MSSLGRELLRSLSGVAADNHRSRVAPLDPGYLWLSPQSLAGRLGVTRAVVADAIDRQEIACLEIFGKTGKRRIFIREDEAKRFEAAYTKRKQLPCSKA